MQYSFWSACSRKTVVAEQKDHRDPPEGSNNAACLVKYRVPGPTQLSDREPPGQRDM
jgi:hypothetical protein